MGCFPQVFGIGKKKIIIFHSFIISVYISQRHNFSHIGIYINLFFISIDSIKTNIAKRMNDPGIWIGRVMQIIFRIVFAKNLTSWLTHPGSKLLWRQICIIINTAHPHFILTH